MTSDADKGGTEFDVITIQLRIERSWKRVTAVLVLVLAVPLIGAAADANGGIDGQALSPRTATHGATMFATMPVERTGVVTENAYADPRMWGERYQELVYGEIGSGLAIGDFDNDGRPDLFVLSKTEPWRLFRNLGDWRFVDVTTQAGLAPQAAGWTDTVRSWIGLDASSDSDAEAWKQSATFVDVNNDGQLDLYVTRFAAPNLLFINQGDGTFKEEGVARGLAIVDSSGAAAFCDYDLDGWLDLYLQTNMLDVKISPEGQRDYLFRNNGDGTFRNVTDAAGIAGKTAGHSATWWDYNGDGLPDVYIANDFSMPDQLYRNNGDGTFTNTIDRVVPHMPYYAMGADVGDVNNDGLLDLFVADMAPSTHERDQRGMAASRFSNRENRHDSPAAHQYMRNALFLNTGTSQMVEAAYLAGLAATDWTWSVLWADLDNDGLLDLHVTNGMIREYHNQDILDRILSSENVSAQRQIVRASPVMAEPNLAFRNAGNLQFENVGPKWGLDQNGVSFGAAFGDLDGDGDLDVAFVNYEAGVTLLRNDSDSGHRAMIALRGTVSNRFGVGATVRVETASGIQMRQLSLSRGYLSSSEPVLHFGLGNDSRILKLTVEWPGGRRQEFSDLPADQKFTFTEPASETTILRSNSKEKRSDGFMDVSSKAKFALTTRDAPADDALRQPYVPLRFDRGGQALAVGDLNGDRRDDIVIGGTPEEPARLLLKKTEAAFADATPLLAAQSMRANDGPVAVFDVDGDGDSDLLITRAGSDLSAGTSAYQPLLLLNDGKGAFQAAPAGALPEIPISAGAAAVADFNRDGRLDVFIGARVQPGKYPLSPDSALLMNRGGAFADVTEALAPALKTAGMVTSTLWSDVDKDGWVDLLLTLEWGGVRYWRNLEGRSFEDWSDRAGFTQAGTGWWSSLAAADFNGDGRTDYAVGNLGKNTRYRATPEEPTLLLLSSMTGGRRTHLVEGYYENGTLYPRQTRKELLVRIPALLKRFPRNDVYSRTPLEKILGEENFARAERFVATELRSGILLSESDGRYRFEVLPTLAQLAPVQGMAAGDFDGDGNADLYLLQNSSAPTSAEGRFGGGLSQLLRGDGRGGFTVVPWQESNLIVSGDAKALAVTDLNDDGWPDFLVSRNNATTLAFQNQAQPGRNSLRVRLQGPSGNSTSIGARVEVEMTDGSVQTAEIYGGHGYYSQSLPAVFVGYADGCGPKRVLVRWPSGAESTYAGPFTDHVVTIVAPQS